MFVRNTEKVFNKEDLYYCFDSKIKDFLCNDKGISFIGKGTDEKSGKDYWLFIKNKDLSDTIYKFLTGKL